MQQVDNLFVFIMLFDYFKVPKDHQQRVLGWGIVGAVAISVEELPGVLGFVWSRRRSGRHMVDERRNVMRF